MPWHWPKTDDSETARKAVEGGVAASMLFAAFTGLMAVLSMICRKLILGIDGLRLIDAGLFPLVGWRIDRMSRIFAVIGLVLYLAEIGDRLLNGPGPSGAVAILTIVFILGFINAIRGTFAFHRYQNQENQPQPTG